jgi:hypothetical protein
MEAGSAPCVISVGYARAPGRAVPERHMARARVRAGDVADQALPGSVRRGAARQAEALGQTASSIAGVGVQRDDPGQGGVIAGPPGALRTGFGPAAGSSR